MAYAKHTPAPWVVGPVDDTVVTHVGADGKRYEVAAIDGDYNQPDEWPVMEANARLIAAAPDMAKALKAVQQRIVEAMDLERISPAQALEELGGIVSAVLIKALGK